MEFGSLDGGEDGEANSAAFVEIVIIFVSSYAFFWNRTI